LAAAAPFAALYLRDVEMVSAGGRIVAGSYVLVSLATSLIAFQVLRISSTIPRYISVGDLLDLAKAAVAGQLMTAIVLFTLTRLDGIPRSVPAIHALILGAGLLISRGLASIADRNRRRAERPRSATAENVILIGLNDWSVLLVKFLQAQAPEQWRVIALLDEEPRWFGRSVNGVQVFGPPAHLDALVEEFAAHGVGTDRVVVGGGPGELSREALAEVKGVCSRLSSSRSCLIFSGSDLPNAPAVPLTHIPIAWRADPSCPIFSRRRTFARNASSMSSPR
jgi:FlaA1/EpsC-like NDP-sugar epimerase